MIDCHVRSNVLGHWVVKTLFTVCVSTSNDSIDVKEAFMHHQNTYKLVVIHLTQHLNTSHQSRSVMYLFFWGRTNGSSLGALGALLWMAVVHCHFLPCFSHLFSTRCLLFFTFQMTFMDRFSFTFVTGLVHTEFSWYSVNGLVTAWRVYE